MKKALPPLTWFRAFDAAARHLSFTLAAEELGLTQSAVSQHIRALETRLGTPLFLRRPKGIALTDAGRRLVPDVAAAMARLQQATDGFLPKATSGMITVATSVSLAQWYIAPGMADLRRALPDLRVRLVTAVWPDDFAAAEADVEIRFGSAEVAGKGGAEPLGPFDLVAVANPQAFGDPRGLTPERLARLPLIQPVGITETWDKLLRSKGVRDVPAPALTVDSHGLAVDLALSGAGVALTSKMIAAPALVQSRLTSVPFDPIPGSEGYFISAAAASAPDAKAFSDWIKARVGRMILDQAAF